MTTSNETPSNEDERLPVHEAVRQLQGEIKNARIVGRIVNGKIELDQEQLNALAEVNPNAVFLALNSPFDPTPCFA
jgi:hypothetical protein